MSPMNCTTGRISTCRARLRCEPILRGTRGLETVSNPSILKRGCGTVVWLVESLLGMDGKRDTSCPIAISIVWLDRRGLQRFGL